VASVAVLGAGVARAGDPTPYSSVSGTCDPDHVSGPVDYFAPGLTEQHIYTLIRFAPSAGSGMFQAGQSGLLAQPFAGGTVIWRRDARHDPGESPRVTVDCQESDVPVPFTATFLDRPTTPATYNGANTSGDESELVFVAPSRANYVADLVLSQGAVQLWGDAAPQTGFDSAGQYALGRLDPGDHTLLVRGAGSGIGQWSVTVHALPVAVVAVRFDSAFARPGTAVPAHYSIDGDTAITATVRSSLGATVRTLAANAPVSAGPQNLVWNGRNDAGADVPDGRYVLHVESHDPTGGTTSGDASITIDGTPPTIAVTSSPHLHATEIVTARVVDALSGVSGGDLKVDGDTRLALRGTELVSYVPTGGWPAGLHKVTVTAIDRAGNRRSLDAQFRVVPPACSTLDARRAVSTTTFNGQVQRAWRKSVTKGGGKLLEKFRVRLVGCRDLNSDKRKEMVVAMEPYAGGLATPWAIFKAGATKWRVAFSRPSARNVDLKIGRFRIAGHTRRAVREHLSDPTKHRFHYAYWSKGRYRYRS
jgi:hypothetical protein